MPAQRQCLFGRVLPPPPVAPNYWPKGIIVVLGSLMGRASLTQSAAVCSHAAERHFGYKHPPNGIYFMAEIKCHESQKHPQNVALPLPPGLTFTAGYRAHIHLYHLTVFFCPNSH